MSSIKRKVLVIDDDLVVLETVKVSLAHLGFEVDTLQKADGAVEKVREFLPDLVLLDLYMPGLGGWDLCRKLKADPATKAIPIMILSGSSEPVDRMSGMEAGAVDYVTKPIDGEALAAKIEAGIGGSRGG
ncbi:MAG: response regulator [Elusimicrobia bacterium]|nr:response regulator [Elusimicrobiota bacterium]